MRIDRRGLRAAGLVPLVIVVGLSLAGTAGASTGAQPGAPQYFSGSNPGGPGTGSAQTVMAGKGTAAQLTSTGFGYGVVSVGFPAGSLFSQLTTLSTDYTLATGNTCAGGSPRFQVVLQQPDGNDIGLYLYFGTPPYGGCPPGGPQTEPNATASTTPEWQIFGDGYDSNVFHTYSDLQGMFGTDPLLEAQIGADGGWTQSSNTQQVTVSNWNVDGTTMFVSPLTDVNCTGTLPPGTYHNVTVPPAMGCAVDSSDSIQGNLVVNKASTLSDQGATINGSLQSNQAKWLQIAGGGSIGSISINGTTGAPSTGSMTNYLCNATVGNGGVTVQNDTAGAPFEIGSGADCSAALTIGGGLTVQGNAGALTIGGNAVTGNINVHNNTGGGTLTNNQAGGSCQLQADHPPIAGSGNTAGTGKPNTCNASA